MASSMTAATTRLGTTHYESRSRAEGGSIFWRCVAHFLSVASKKPE